jgi:glycosyltransferase involved in cell wall biosynthesis
MTDVADSHRSVVSHSNAGVRSKAAVPDRDWSVSPIIGPDAPFFETPPNTAATRRMLLVFFYFAPSAEVGVLRWLSLAKFGAERGWAIDVVTLHPMFMGTVDNSRLMQLPNGVRVFGFSGIEPLWFRGLMSAWRKLSGSSDRNNGGPALNGHRDATDAAQLTTPADAPEWRRGFRSRVHFKVTDVFARRAVSLGQALAASQRYDVVVSSGPPHAGHLAAREIAATTGIPFVMDMRDPWSEHTAAPEELRSAAWQRITKIDEDRCIASATAVVVTSDAHEELQVEKYPFLRGRIRTVMNGADQDVVPKSQLGNQFVIGFAGKIYLGRDPRVLFRAAAKVVRETGASPEEFIVEFMGDSACNGVPMTAIAQEQGLGDHFRSHGFRPRREALAFLSRAALLVSLPLRTTMTLPAKLFEYMRFDAWLLALAEKGSATEALLRGTGADVVEPEDEANIVRVLRARYEAFRAGRRPLAINHDGRFDRSTQSERMFGLLEEIAASPRGGAARR